MTGSRILGGEEGRWGCAWSRFDRRTCEPEFRSRNNVDQATLAELFAWDEDEFLRRSEGSAIRRSGHERWLRNIAIALGNAPTTPDVLAALQSRRGSEDRVVRESVEWALAQHARRAGAAERATDPHG